jgi:hypothetical protein
VAACYAALAVAVYLPLGPFDGTSLPKCNCGDNAMAAAFLQWTPWALLHGQNPLLTTYQYFPQGADLASNTTMPVLGLLLAPVTLTAGPIVALNLLLRLAFLTSAWSAWAVFRRLGATSGAAFAGGLLYGFSPYMIGQGQSHANLLFVALFPPIMLLTAEAVVAQRKPARRTGCWLGLLAALQYGISSELLADAAVFGALVLALLALVHRDAVRAKLGHACRSIGWALCVFVPLTAYPIWLALFGPDHPNGPPRAPVLLHALSSDLLGTVTPTDRQLVSLGHLGAVGSGWVFGNSAENGIYLGLPLLAFVVVLVVRGRADRRVVWAVVAAGVAEVLALGPTLHAGGNDTGVPLPETVLTHVPLLDGIVPIRFSLFAFLALAVAVALGLTAERGRSAPTRSRAALLAGLTALALVPLLPRLPYPRVSTGRGAYASYPVPAFFSPGGGADAIPAGTPVLVYPYSDPAPTAGTVNYAVLWQAVAQERFRLLDGDATRPGPYGYGTEAAPDLVPMVLETMLRDAYFGPFAHDGPTTLDTGPFPELTPAVLGEVRAALAGYDVSTVVVYASGFEPREIERAFEKALGRAPVRTDGVFVWYGVQMDLARVRG